MAGSSPTKADTCPDPRHEEGLRNVSRKRRRLPGLIMLWVVGFSVCLAAVVLAARWPGPAASSSLVVVFAPGLGGGSRTWVSASEC
eukprot:2374420-Pyramimonas_sp.AAC.1